MAISFVNRDEQLSVYVWELIEGDDWLLKRAELTSFEVSRFNEFRSESRKRQWLAVRTLANKVFGRKVLIEYDSEGRPSIKDEGGISISHTEKFVALLVGRSNYLGVDIESVNRNYSRIKSKFVTDDESYLFSANGFWEVQYLPIIWSAKEAAFKAACRSELDFTRDISVKAVSSNEKQTAGSLDISLIPSVADGKFKFCLLDDHVIVWGEYGSL